MVEAGDHAISADVLRKLVGELAAQTATMSSSGAMRRAPAYRALAGAGRTAVPVLLAALRGGEALIPAMMLLGEITGADPVPPGERGMVEKMAARWIGWARTHDAFDRDQERDS